MWQEFAPLAKDGQQKRRATQRPLPPAYVQDIAISGRKFLAKSLIVTAFVEDHDDVRSRLLLPNSRAGPVNRVGWLELEAIVSLEATSVIVDAK